MTLKEILGRLESLFSNLLFVLILQVLGTIGLIYLTNIWVKDQNIQMVVDLGIAALGFLAASQTFLITTNFRRYITRELLTELASSQGRIIRRVVINKDFKEIHPGDEYVVEFLIEGKLLIQTPVPRILTPVLRMEPPLFQGDAEGSSEQFSVWHGQPISCNLKGDSTWELRGQVKFNTYKINPTTEVSSAVALNLGFQGEDSLLFDLELERIPVHLITQREVFQDLIRLGTLKKLPPGYDVLTVSSDPEFCTNLIFLSKRLHELGSEKGYSDQVRDQVRGLEAAMARFINEAFSEIKHPSKRLQLAEYKPQPYESEVNFPALLGNILEVIRTPKRGRPLGKVLVAIYQTGEFIARLEGEGGLGICLFGFGRVAPSNIQVIFDLSQLELNHDETGNPCQVDWSELKQISESSKEYFEKYAPKLIAKLTQKQRGDRSKLGAFPMSKGPEQTSRELGEVLSLMQRSANDSLKRGCFVNSEPAITPYWINLGIFEDELYRANVERALEEVVVLVTDRCAQAYKINAERLRILNLCSEYSGIANELPILWQFEHPRFRTYAVGVDQETLPYEIRDVNAPREVILLTPLDSYVSTLETVLQRVKEGNNHVICIVSLFSVAKAWDYLSASECFDIIPLFRVNPKFPSALTPLARMDDYKRLKPWLFEFRSATGGGEGNNGDSA